MLNLCIGLSYSFISVVFFGSWFVLVKERNPRDGLFAQWMMYNGMMIFGLGLLICEGTDARFYPMSALGGGAWGLGIGPGYLVPDVVNCLGNFIIGYYGLLGTNRVRHESSGSPSWASC